MDKQRRVLGTIDSLNYMLFILLGFISFIFASLTFAFGFLAGGFLAMINFYLLKKTLKSFLDIDVRKNYGFVLAKYYVRFIVTSLVIFFLIQCKIINPFGLFLGLSIVVISVVVAAVIELKKLILKEAV